jgi:hypothetical protein
LRSPIEELVNRLFREIKAQAKRGELCQNPVTGGWFVWGLDPMALHKKEAVVALRAREWFAVHGPADAPPFPYEHEIDSYRDARGLKGVVGFYARSLSRLDHDFQKHPSFHDFARGLMAFALEYGLWNLEGRCLDKTFPAASASRNDAKCLLGAARRIRADHVKPLQGLAERPAPHRMNCGRSRGW